MGGQIAAVAALNLGLLALIVLIWKWIASRRPMTAGRLRQSVGKAKLVPVDRMPCGGDLCDAAALLRALGTGGETTDLVRALLWQWAEKGRISLCMRPKRRLRSFGEAVQATLIFPEERCAPEGAAGLLYERLSDWAAEDGSLQTSELYQLARQDWQETGNHLRQLELAGQHGLRTRGMSHLEGKKSRFGFSVEEREIYTPRGVREARAAEGYRLWVREGGYLDSRQTAMAVLLGERETESPAQALAAAVVDGARAGKRVALDKRAQK